MFVFRRVSEGRYVHLGGAGRGTGWAGIVELGEAEEPFVQSVIDGDTRPAARRDGSLAGLRPVLRARGRGRPREHRRPRDLRRPDRHVRRDLRFRAPRARAARRASRSSRWRPAKRLADELEVLHAVQDLVHTHAETFADGLQRLVDQATMALSCDLGLAYLSGEPAVLALRPPRRRAARPIRRPGRARDDRRARDVSLVHPESGGSPSCRRRSASPTGCVAYYLLELKRPLPGFLLVLHTRASAARGFTLLCQSLGHKLVDAAEPLLAAALLRDSMRDELERAGAEARRDSLTGLANRLGWTEALASASPCEGSPASIVKLDCRGLKKINDTYGHHAGDRVLCRIADALTACIRDDDLARARRRRRVLDPALRRRRGAGRRTSSSGSNARSPARTASRRSRSSSRSARSPRATTTSSRPNAAPTSGWSRQSGGRAARLRAASAAPPAGAEGHARAQAWRNM